MAPCRRMQWIYTKVVGRDAPAGTIQYRNSKSGVRGAVKPVRTVTNEKRYSAAFKWGDEVPFDAGEKQDGFFVQDAEREDIEFAAKLVDFAERKADQKRKGNRRSVHDHLNNGDRGASRNAQRVY